MEVTRPPQFQSKSGNVAAWKQQWAMYIDTMASK